MRQYWSEGTDAVSLNELCRLAGVSKPAVYREFGGEDGLIDAALELYATAYLTPVSRHTTTEGPFGESLMQLVDMMIDYDEAQPAGCLLAKMRVLSSNLGPATRARVEALRDSARADYAAWVDRAKSRGEIDATMSTDVAAAFVDLQLTALLMQVALGEDPELLRAHARLTFAGLLGPAAA